MKTNITKSCGPDELHPRMLKELAVELAAPMTKLFNQSLFLKGNSLLSTRQFGFLGERSTILQLLTLLDKCVDAISRGNDTDVVYLDFQKAFDTVPQKC